MPWEVPRITHVAQAGVAFGDRRLLSELASEMASG